MHIYDDNFFDILEHCATEQDENHLMLNRVLHKCVFGENYTYTVQKLSNKLQAYCNKIPFIAYCNL